MSQNLSRPLDPGIRRWLEASYGTDLGRVRVHTGPRADRVAAQVGGVGASRGDDVYLAGGLTAQHALHVLAHEVAHTTQRHASVVPTGAQLRRDEQQAEAMARLALAGRATPYETAPPTAPPTATDRRVLQGFNAWEHRLLGDASPSDLAALATGGQRRPQVLQQQCAYNMLFADGIAGVTREQMARALPEATIVTLPNGLSLTLGELNAIGGDFAAGPQGILDMPAKLLSGIVQQVRQESANRLRHLRGEPTRNFVGAIGPYASESIVDLIRETKQIDAFTEPLGVNHYNGLLARNACHFAPFAWHRWRDFNTQARDLARQAHRSADPQEKERLTNAAWVYQAYADHFIEDAFAAGHLVNKTLIMQWFTAWAKDRIFVPVPDWDLVKHMTADEQPDLMGRELYAILEDLRSNDPQTAEEQASFAARIRATRLRATDLPLENVYRQYLAFLDAAVVQLSTNFVHNHFNDASLYVRDSDGAEAYKIFGDEQLLRFGAVVARPSKLVQASQEAIRDILTTGDTNCTQQTILRKLPALVHFDNAWISLRDWHSGRFENYCRNVIFSDTLSMLKAFATLISPRLGRISVDQSNGGLSTAWETSLPGCGYHNVQTLFDGTRAYAASNGYVYRLDVATGRVAATNSLKGYGYHDVQIVSNGGNLYVGTYGYVIVLDGRTLEKKWQVSLPGCGYKKVNLLLTQDGRLYAGSNGYVYRVDPNAARVIARNGLSGRGFEEVRLAAYDDVVVAGTNGYVVGLNAANVTTRWQTSLPGAGWDVVDVAVTGSSFLVGSNGHVYLVDPERGTVTAHNNLSGLGYHTVNVSSDGHTAFVGTNGTILGLAVTNLVEQWKTPLSNAGGRVVDVSWHGGWLFVGVNGYLHQIDPTTGRVIYVNQLKGRGFNDVSVASDGVTAFCGINGYVVGVKPDPR